MGWKTRSLLAMACACHASAPAPVIDAAVANSAPTASAPVASASVSVREVHRGPTSVAPVADAKRKIALLVKTEAEIPNAMVPRAALPTWLPAPVREDEAFHTAHVEPDGGVLAQSRHTLLAFDKSHRFEAGLDFEPFRGDLVRHLVLGGDHATIDRGTVIVNPRRLGGVVFVAGSDMERSDMSFLLAVDLATATSLWKTAHEVVPAGFEIAVNHAIASSHESGRWALDVIELDTGHIVDRVPTAHGPYHLELQADGSIHGRLLASEVVSADGKSYALDVAVTTP